MEPIVVTVLNDFTEYPGLRHCKISDDSGEEFYHKVLNYAFKDALEKRTKLIVELDNTAGFAPSFIDEAFGNLVYDFTLDEVKKTLEIRSNQEPSWVDTIKGPTYTKWEQRRISEDVPKITETHEPWYRLVKGQLELKLWLKKSV
ncbi:STAS-like domain-containing protein [Carboxylicivirga marina]|uniref:STAS-like domain-containing protein n=1 Tax=Carboxylicivirga marina TaxID=2800988 RepID=A0ABS1HGA0_9BACT|nr:STAS-like domain-containing protein [Carboxylicivirga marina]MBK3516674.1 STAS-like domain-containing protein [Carboxylicivirga marina]